MTPKEVPEEAIEYISFLPDGKTGRTKEYANTYTGLFQVSSHPYMRGNPYQFCVQHNIEDPTLNLKSGEKIRVFQGGDRSQYTEYARSAIEKHMEIYKRPKQIDPFDFSFCTYFSD